MYDFKMSQRAHPCTNRFQETLNTEISLREPQCPRGNSYCPRNCFDIAVIEKYTGLGISYPSMLTTTQLCRNKYKSLSERQQPGSVTILIGAV